MKNRIFYKLSLSLLWICLISFGVQAQTVIVGEVKNGTGVVTNLTEATRVLKGGLSSAATVSNVAIVWEQENKDYYLICRIGNDAISAKAIKLVPEGEILLARAGPGVQIECIGHNCSTCIFAIRHWRLVCVCDEITPAESAKCDMNYKWIITL